MNKPLQSRRAALVSRRAASYQPTTTYDTLVGVMIVHWRNVRSMSQVALAHALDMAQPWLSRVEAGHTPLSVARLADIGRALGLSSARIIADADGAMSYELAHSNVKVTTSRRDAQSLTAKQINAILLGADSITIRSIYSDGRT